MKNNIAKAQLVSLIIALSYAIGCNHAVQSLRSVSDSPHTLAKRDLDADERRGGHTLKRHVGRSDSELHDRLARESHIHAASTYTDREAAEAAVGQALRNNLSEVNRWLASGRMTNLALQEDIGHPVGRTLSRDRTGAVPCSHVTVVLKRVDADSYYVLTSYPECGSNVNE